MRINFTQKVFQNRGTMILYLRKIRILIILLSSVLPGCEKSNTFSPSGDYSVFAWNDLGMHCLNPTYDKLVILPPYNNIMAQVVKRGDPPEIITSGITVEYRLINNTTSHNKREYKDFWDSSNKLFQVTLAQNIGLKVHGLSGEMETAGNYFVAEGIPVVPVYDDNTWDPYQIAEISVKGTDGKVLINTRATVPTSDEMNCAKCHGTNAFDDILAEHDSENETNFSNPSAQPVLCASCHPDPALGINTGSEMYLSRAIHDSHASRTGIGCYDCHPGATTKCSRSIKHTSPDGNLTECHGNMADVAGTIAAGRVPWSGEPACSRDDYQSKQYQGFTSRIKTIGSCGVCQDNSRGVQDELSEFNEKHGGVSPEKSTGCNACHISTPTATADWPHSYSWKNSN